MYELIGQGNTAEIYDIGEGKILKLFREGIAQNAVEREYTGSRIAAKYLKQAPETYELTNRDGRDGIVFQKVGGTELIQMMLTHPMRLARYAGEFARYHSEINRPISEEMRTVREKLTEEIGWENDLTGAEKEMVLDRLALLPDGDRLCHFDFHPGNVMVSDGEVFFLDWMTACKGDACADAARTYLLFRFGEPMHASTVQKILTRAVMVVCGRIYLRKYCRAAEADRDDIAKWLVPVAAARLSEWLTEHERKKLIRFIRGRM